MPLIGLPCKEEQGRRYLAEVGEDGRRVLFYHQLTIFLVENLVVGSLLPGCSVLRSAADAAAIYVANNK